MKTLNKILIAIAIIVISAGSANAKFRFGIKAGMNVDKMHFSKSLLDADNRCGFTGGVMTEFQVPLIGIGVDLSLMYSSLNSTFDITTVGADGTQDAKEYNTGKHFLEIPLNLKYKISLPVVGNIISPYIFTGPAFAIKLDKNTMEAFKTKTCQVVWNVGLGLELVKHVQVGASYGFGINNIVDKWLNTTDDVKIKNNYWTITAAYLF